VRKREGGGRDRGECNSGGVKWSARGPQSLPPFAARACLFRFAKKKNMRQGGMEVQ
jgi:hypothetical protein